ncbi:MAG: lipopolysaccharide biosynthesis protein [Pirellulales bacterium]|nr:lipopolysaccharide biosynthesis protein [Pirellulales bacterium]
MTPYQPSARAQRWLAPESLATSIALGILLTVVARFAGLGRGVFFARWMDRAELGSWSLAYNAISVVSFFLLLGLPGALSRYVERHRREGRLRSFLIRTLVAGLGVGVAACLVGMIFASPLARFFFDDSQRITLMALTALGTFSLVATNLVQGVFQGLRLSRINSLVQMGQSIGFALLGAVVLLLWRDDAIGSAWAYLLSAVVVMLPQTWLLYVYLRTLSPSPAAGANEPIWRPMLIYSFGTWSAGGLSELWRVVDRWLLVHDGAGETVERLAQIGSYYIVEMITLPLLTLAVQISILVLPHIVHLYEDGRDADAQRLVRLSTKLVVLMLVFGSYLLVTMKHFLLVTVFDDTSGQGLAIFEFVLMAMIAASAHYMLRSYVLCRERVWFTAAGWGVGLAANLALAAILIPRYELVGATLATMISAQIALVTIVWLSRIGGLAIEARLVGVLVLPLVLLAPPLATAAALGALVVVAATTHLVFDPQEKQQLRDKLNAASARFLPRRFSERVAVHA